MLQHMHESAANFGMIVDLDTHGCQYRAFTAAQCILTSSQDLQHIEQGNASMDVMLRACRHSPLAHYCWWNKYVANPIKKYGYVGCGRQAMRLLKTEILEKTLLRRTKVQCADVLALPPRSALEALSHVA